MAGNYDETVEQHDEFARLSIRSQRGNGTDDRDRVKVTVQQATLADLEAERDRAVALVEAALDGARENQPDE